jgi:carboxyl-terminal processing protease
MKNSPNRNVWKTIGLAAGCVLFTGATVATLDSGRSLYTKLKVFGDLLEKVRSDYIDEKDAGTLVDSAIRGLVSDLDPHTSYYTKEQYDRWNQDFEGYSGIGIYFDVIDGRITVVSIIRGGPAEKVGLAVGDRIVTIGDESVVGIRRDDVPLKLMGPRGTKVEIWVERNGWARPRLYSIVREEVHLESVANAFIIKPQVGYIGIGRFASTTEAEMEKALQKLELLGMRQLVLDLRQNGGGYLEAAVRVADKFLPGGRKITYTEGRIRESLREYFSTQRNDHPLIPMIVVIDRTSASASEIVAGALQDWDRALIVGETSFGKGLVQTPYKFVDGSALLLTTARYHTPSGRVIQRPYEGVPDEEYYDEIFDETWRKKERNRTDHPAFQTLILKRRVYGGGGISPDVTFQSEPDTVRRALREWLAAPQRPFFTYVEQFANRRPEIQEMEQYEFLRNFRFSDSEVTSFRGYLRASGATVPALEFEKSREDVQYFLKKTLAEKLSGFKVQAFRDRQLLEALSHMPEAEDLLERAYPVR